MKLGEIAKMLKLTELTPEIGISKIPEITKGYASDLLSDVLANAQAGGIVVTLQVHMNIIATAVHAGLEAVIFSSGRIPEESVSKKAIEEGIALYVSQESTFDIVGQLYALGLRGDSR